MTRRGKFRPKIRHNPMSKSPLARLRALPQSESPPTCAALLLLVALLWGIQSLLRGFWEPDEARFVYVAREMAADGHFFVPFRSGVYYAHKPPLLFWMMNIAAAPFAGHINGFAARFPSLLGVFLSLLSTSAIADRLGGAKAAWRSVIVLSTTYLFWQVNTMAQQDALLTGLIMSAIALGTAERPSAARLFAAGFCAGAGMLLKGPVAIFIPALAIAAMKWKRGAGARVRSVLAFLAFFAGLIIPPAVWLIGAYFENPPAGYFREIIYSQTVERAGGGYGHLKGPFYFLFHFPIEFLPWTFALVYTAVIAVRRRLRHLLRPFVWVLLIIVFFSVIPTKRNLYILAAYPPAAIIVALAWDELQTRLPPRFLDRAAELFLALFFLAGLIVLPIVNIYKTPAGIREAVAPYLAADQNSQARLGLVGTDGEIYALYAGVKGMRFRPQDNPPTSPEALSELDAFIRYIADNDSGAAVVGSGFWKEHGEKIEQNPRITVQNLSVGKKRGDKSDKLLLWKSGGEKHGEGE